MALGRMYSIIMPSTGISVVRTLMRISAPSDAVVLLHRLKVTNTDQEGSNQLPIIVQRVTSDGTGTGATINPRQVGDPVFGGSAVVNLTAEPTGGTPLEEEGENILNGWLWVPTPEEQIIISPSGRLAIKLNAVPGVTPTAMTVTAIVEELGG